MGKVIYAEQKNRREIMGEMHSDIYFGDINKRYEDLAALSHENWNMPGRSDNNVLKNYLKYTYKKLEEENKIKYVDDYGLFNTGLFTEYYMNIAF